jgi:succinate dehydrogenase hydrophobic anchor subunit
MTAEAAPDDVESAEAGAPDETRPWSWHLLQITSWILLVLLPVHVLSTWVFHDPGHFGVALYADRWHDGAWRLFDGALVVLAFIHGGIGLNGVLAGPSRSPAARTAITIAITVVLVVAGLLAVSSILSFDVS